MPKENFQLKKKLTIGCAAAAPVAYLGMYIVAPGYITPFLTNRYGIVLLVLLFGWQAIGSFAYIKVPSEKVYSLRLQSFLFLLIFVLPNLSIAVLGPALGPYIAFLVVSVFFPQSPL